MVEVVGMKRTFKITITIEETTEANDSKPVEDTWRPLTAFEGKRPQPPPPYGNDGGRRIQFNTKRQPTYQEGRALHPAGNEREPHTRYGTGRKIHTCTRCGSPRRRLNPKTGTCGLGEMCRVLSDEKEVKTWEDQGN